MHHVPARAGLDRIRDSPAKAGRRVQYGEHSLDELWRSVLRTCYHPARYAKGPSQTSGGLHASPRNSDRWNPRARFLHHQGIGARSVWTTETEAGSEKARCVYWQMDSRWKCEARRYDGSRGEIARNGVLRMDFWRIRGPLSRDRYGAKYGENNGRQHHYLRRRGKETMYFSR